MTLDEVRKTVRALEESEKPAHHIEGTIGSFNRVTDGNKQFDRYGRKPFQMSTPRSTHGKNANGYSATKFYSCGFMGHKALPLPNSRERVSEV